MSKEKRCFEFEVRREKLQTVETGREVDRDAIIRTDTNQILGVVGRDYRLIPHTEIVHEVESRLKQIGDYSLHRETITRNGSHLFIEYSFAEIKHEVQVGDICSMKIILVNSLDGFTRFGFYLGAIRLVCSNGMKVLSRLMTFCKKHTDGIDIDGLLQTTANMQHTFKTKMENFRLLATTQIGDFDKRLLKIEENRVIPLRLTRAIKDEGQGQTRTDWDLYNRYTERLTHRFTGSYDRLNQIHDHILTEFNVH